LNYWTDTRLQINKNASFKGDPYFHDLADYEAAYYELYPSATAPPTLPHVFSTYSCIVLMEAARRADSLDQNSIADFVRRSYFQTFFGTYSYSSENVLLMSGYIYQYINGSRVVIGPQTLQEADLVSPMPTWAERRPRTDLWGVEIAAIIILSIAISILMVCVLFLVVFRAHPNIRAGSPLFLGAMLLGCILIYIGLLQSLPSRLSTINCILKPWLLSLGSTLLFGAVFAKTWRIFSLWSNDSVKVFRISDAMVAGLLGLFVLPDIPLLLAWTFTGNVKATLVVVDQYRPIKNYVDCSSNGTTAPALLWTVFGWHVRSDFLGHAIRQFGLTFSCSQMLLFIVGSGLAWKVRRIPMKMYDESKAIAFSIYNVGFFGIILAVLLSVASTDYLVLYGILVFLATVGTLITVTFIFGTKLNFVLSHDGSRASTSNPSSVTSGFATNQFAPKSKPHGTQSASQSELQTMSTLAAHGSVAPPASSRTSDLERELEKAKVRISKLKKKVKELEGAQQDS
jgi:hypothetical protein